MFISNKVKYICMLVMLLNVFFVYSTYGKSKEKNREINLEDVALSDVITYVKSLTKLNIHVQWKALAIANIDRDTLITLKVKNITVSRLLDLLCNQISDNKSYDTTIYWTLDKNIITITTGSALNTHLKIRVIDVGIIVSIVPNFKGPRIKLNINNDEEENREFFDDKDSEKDTEEDIVDMRKKIKSTLKNIVMESIGSEMWRENGGKGSVKFLGDKMIISQTKLGFILLQKAGVIK